jgi:hypothetical protein
MGIEGIPYLEFPAGLVHIPILFVPHILGKLMQN